MPIKLSGIFLFLYLILITPDNAYACIAPKDDLRPEREIVSERFSAAKRVFVAKVISVEQTPIEIDGHSATIEHVKFRVVKIFKGEMTPDQIYETKTTIFNNLYDRCGIDTISVINKPVWFEVPPGVPAIFPASWLIYKSDNSNDEMLKPSAPINFKYSGNDLKIIKKILKSPKI
jgi:hypothetical protein